MKKFLIATHGLLADGFASSIKILLGREDITTINAYLDNSENSGYESDIKNFIDSLTDDDQGVIFTDLLGGSVNQKVMNILASSNKDIFLITQTNLPIVLQMVLDEEKITAEKIDKFIEESKVERVDIKKLMDSTSEEDSFF